MGSPHIQFKPLHTFSDATSASMFEYQELRRTFTAADLSGAFVHFF